MHEKWNLSMAPLAAEAKNFGHLTLEGHRQIPYFDLLGGIGRMRHAIVKG